MAKTNKTYGWFKVYWNFLDNMSPESALFLSYLIDIEPLMKNRDGEYFRLSNSFIQERFVTWSNYTIKTRFDELIEKGYIQLQEKYQMEHGNKCKTRWVKINELTEELIKDLTNDLTYDLTENFGLNKNNKNNNINNNNNSESNSPSDNIPSDSIVEKTNNNDATPTPPPVEKPKRQSLKNKLTEYVDSLDYQQETKDVLMNWIFAVGLPKNVGLKQLSNKLKDIWEQCNDDEALVREAIHRAYLNSWCAFFLQSNQVSKPTQSYKTPAQPLQSSCNTITQPKRVALSNEVF